MIDYTVTKPLILNTDTGYLLLSKSTRDVDLINVCQVDEEKDVSQQIGYISRRLPSLTMIMSGLPETIYQTLEAFLAEIRIIRNFRRDADLLEDYGAFLAESPLFSPVVAERLRQSTAYVANSLRCAVRDQDVKLRLFGPVYLPGSYHPAANVEPPLHTDEEAPPVMGDEAAESFLGSMMEAGPINEQGARVEKGLLERFKAVFNGGRHE